MSNPLVAQEVFFLARCGDGTLECWVFATEALAQEQFMALCNEDVALCRFAPDNDLPYVETDCPRKDVAAIAAWLAANGSWDYDEDVFWRLRKMPVREQVQDTQSSC